jgi:CRP-like cAMP-binding protein
MTKSGSIVEFAQGTILNEANSEVEQVLFPLEGIISLRVVMRTGSGIEVSSIGPEGVYGAVAGLGLYRPLTHAVVQSKLLAVSVTAPNFRRLVSQSEAVMHLCVRYNDMLLNQAQISTACNALHKVETRLCRWLLQTSDQLRSDTIRLTQYSIATALGVRRTSISDVASKIQAAGHIHYGRGTIVILDREGLKAASCECYHKLAERMPV